MDLDLRETSERQPGSVEAPKKLTLRQKIKAFFANPKKRLIFIIVLGLILIGLVGTGLYFISRDKESKKAADSIPPKPVLYQALLDGIMTDIDSSKKHPLAIMVENHTDARPQAGINKASIIYEAIAEGGITRYLALYGTYESDQVGPVRSARTYYIDWLRGYNAYYAHVGGNIDALDKIQVEKILDLDQFRYSSPYWRDTSFRVASEHTMFVSTPKLRAIAAENNYTTANNFTIYKFKDDPSADSIIGKALPEAQKITVNFGNANYNVVFDFDKQTDSYNRSIGAKADLDRLTKEQITAKNIVVMTVKRQSTVTKINEQGWNMDTIGEGTAKIYIDGKEILGKWKKSSATDREIFYDEAGKEIIFNRGKLWICVTPPEATVTSQITPSATPPASAPTTNQ